MPITSKQTRGATPASPYPVGDRVFDEAFFPDGSARPPYDRLFADLDDDSLASLHANVRSELAERGVNFGPPHTRAPFGIDPIPRLITESEWIPLEAGIAQRARALNHFLEDIYNDQRIIEAGAMPRRVIDEATFFEPRMIGSPNPVRGQIYGPDVVRDSDGELLIIEDNLRSPSGLSYAGATRDAVLQNLDVDLLSPRSIEGAFSSLAASLRMAAPDSGGDPSIALLTDGAISSGWFEHRDLSKRLGIALVSVSELRLDNGRVHASIDGRDREIQVLYNRTTTQRLTDAQGRLNPIGELLSEPLGSGAVACVNSFGAGVAEDKAVHRYVEEMIRFYLSEEPLIRSARTLDLGDEKEFRETIERLDELVIKPRSTFGGRGVVIGPKAPRERRLQLSNLVRRNPERFVAQETVTLSRHPTVCAGKLAPRHVDLRPYVFSTGNVVSVAPGALTRFARHAGDLIVSSARGGGAKDTWIV